MRQLARGLQIIAFFLLPLAMILQIANSISVGQMLILCVTGFCLFYIGRIVEGFLRSGRE